MKREEERKGGIGKGREGEREEEVKKGRREMRGGRNHIQLF